MRRFVVVTLLGFFATALFADTQGDEIAHKFYDQKTPIDTTSSVTMLIQDHNGNVKTRKLMMYMKDTPEGKKSLAIFIAPADVNGTKFLTVSHRGHDSDQWLYLPALKKVRRISSSSKDGEFLGSDLFYFDMEQRFFEDATYTFLGENLTLADPALAGMKFWEIAMNFKDPHSPYSKSVVWINMQDNSIYKTDCYDKKDGALLKTILIDKVKVLKGYTIPVHMTVSNHKKGSQTQMILSDDLSVDVGLPDSTVSIQRLQE